MRRHGSLLLVAALMGLGVVAAVDAVRGESREDPGAPRSVPYTPPQPEEELRERGITGTLYLTRRTGGGCRFLTFRLPELRAQAEVETRLCALDAAPDGQTVVLGAACPGRGIEIRDESGRLAEPRGSDCAPAWTSDSRLSLVRHGSVVVTGRGVVLARERFLREIRLALNLPRGGRYSIRELDWVSDHTLVLLARHRTEAVRNHFLAVFRRGRLHPETSVDLGPGVSHVYVDGRSGEIVTRGRFYWGSRGQFLSDRPGVFGAESAYARSPDGLWIVTASRRAVYIYPAGGEDRPVDPVEIAIRNVVDLAWG